ncbi:MAG: hypothetical protein ACAI44_17635, partial [Candidatus Sericytochromatia bacterium]
QAIAKMHLYLPEGQTHDLRAKEILQMDRTPEVLHAVIGLLGKDHPKTVELRAQLEQAGEDPKLLRAVHHATAEAIGAHVKDTVTQAKASLNQEITSERTPADQRWKLRQIFLSGNDRATIASVQQSRLSDQGQAHIDEAGKLRALAAEILGKAADPATLGPAIAALGSHPEAAKLQDRLDTPGQSPEDLKSLRNEVVRALHAQVKTLTSLGQSEKEAATKIKVSKGEGAEELIGNVSLVASLISSGNTAMKVIEKSADGFMGVAGSTVGIAFGGLYIVAESLALRRNVIRLDAAITKSEGAKLVLAPAAERPAMIARLELQIADLSQPRWFRTLDQRSASVEKLQAKVVALKAMGTAESTTEAQAIAKQIVVAAAVGHKALRVAKNVAGLAAGAIAISVAAGALATPVGWAAAGVVLAATVGLVVYNRVKIMSNTSKIENLLNNRLAAGREIIKLQQLDDSKEPGTESYKALADLQAHQESTMIKLLTVSPQHAAKAIIDGLKATPADEQMRSLATQALNVPVGMTQAPFSAQQEAELTQYLKRGLPLMPKL